MPHLKVQYCRKNLPTTLLIAPLNNKFMLVDVKPDLCTLRCNFLHKKKPKTKASSFEAYTTRSYYSITKVKHDFKFTMVKNWILIWW
jgi:hypothetical protein